MSKIVINQDFNYVSDANDIITDLDALTDVNITAAADGQILVYNGTSSQWENVNNSEITGLTALSDVTITSVADDQFLRYDSGTSQWINETVTLTTDLDGLTDVDVPSPSDGQALVYNNATGNWEAVTLAAGVTDIDDLTDVTVTTPSNGQYLIYNGTSSQWENVSATYLSDITGESIGDLSDVTAPTPSNGDYLVYNSTSSAWENTATSFLTDITGEVLEDLSNVTSGASTGDILYRSSSNWTPTDTIEIQPTTRVVFNNIAELLYPNTSATQLAFENTTSNGITGDITAILAESENGAGTTKIFARINMGVDDKTAASESGYFDFTVQDAGTLSKKLEIKNTVEVSNSRFIANNKATLKSDGSFDGIEFDTGTGENQYRINIANATGAALAAGDQSQLIGWEITATDGTAYPVLLGAEYDDGTDGNAFLFKTYDDGVSTFTVNEVVKIAENRTALYRSLNLAPYASGSLPSSPATGDMVRVTDENNAPYYYDGTEWLNLYDIDGGSY